jgi:hypothetical protein
LHFDGSRIQDFDIAEIARGELQKVIDKFKEDVTLTIRQRLGISSKSAKTKTVELLEESVQTNYNELKEAVDELETGWKENNGAVSQIMSTL